MTAELIFARHNQMSQGFARYMRYKLGLFWITLVFCPALHLHKAALGRIFAAKVPGKALGKSGGSAHYLRHLRFLSIAPAEALAGIGVHIAYIPAPKAAASGDFRPAYAQKPG